MVNGLRGASVPRDIDLIAESVRINTVAGNDVVTLSPHTGHLDVLFSGLDFHVIGASEFALDTHGSVSVEDLSTASVPADIDIVNAELVLIETGAGDDVVTLSEHESHLDVAFATQTFHVIGARMLVLDTQGGFDTVTVNDLSGLAQPVDLFFVNAEEVIYL